MSQNPRPRYVITLDAVEAILKEDLPEDAEFSRRQSEERNYVEVSIWARRCFTNVHDTHPLRFQICVVGGRIVIDRIRHPDTITGPSFVFELADPGVWQQLYSFFAKECVL